MKYGYVQEWTRHTLGSWIFINLVLVLLLSEELLHMEEIQP